MAASDSVLIWDTWTLVPSKIPTVCQGSKNPWTVWMVHASSCHLIWKVGIGRLKWMRKVDYTAFTVGPLGFYECICMPFGLTNAPTTFQRLMESCLWELHLQYCIIYLDDIIIFSKTPKEHLQRLRLVFQQISEAGLKLKPSKCEFFRTRLEYLGHTVSKKGIETNPKKVQVIWDCQWLTNITETHSFLGLQLLPQVYQRLRKNCTTVIQTHLRWEFKREEKLSTMGSRLWNCIPTTKKALYWSYHSHIC